MKLKYHLGCMGVLKFKGSDLKLVKAGSFKMTKASQSIALIVNAIFSSLAATRLAASQNTTF